MAARRARVGSEAMQACMAGVEVGDGGGDRVDGGVAGRGGVGIEFSAELAERSELLDELARRASKSLRRRSLCGLGGVQSRSLRRP